MRLLFVHKNFPGQYRHLAAYYALVTDALRSALRAHTAPQNANVRRSSR